MTSPRALGPGRFLLLVTFCLAVFMAAAAFLPDNRYVRFSDLHEEAVLKAAWIYERIHFDPTPIDIVFVGTSHTVFGIDSATVEAARRDNSGSPLHVVNFGLQHLGRNTQYLIAREVLETRPVKMLVIEVQEDEPRAMHPAFGSLANPRDILAAPLLINTSFFDDLVRLPLRQIRLLLHSLAPERFGDRAAFDPNHFAGSHWTDTNGARGPEPGSVPAQSRDKLISEAEMERQRAQFRRTIGRKLSLPASVAFLENRANTKYLIQLCEMAKAKHVEVRFLYMPNYKTTQPPSSAAIYAPYGPLLHPEPVYASLGHWLDIGHLNAAGARELSKWLGAALAGDGG